MPPAAPTGEYLAKEARKLPVDSQRTDPRLFAGSFIIWGGAKVWRSAKQLGIYCSAEWERQRVASEYSESILLRSHIFKFHTVEWIWSWRRSFFIGKSFNNHKMENFQLWAAENVTKTEICQFRWLGSKLRMTKIPKSATTRQTRRVAKTQTTHTDWWSTKKKLFQK